jgi:hypothetical protein
MFYAIMLSPRIISPLNTKMANKYDTKIYLKLNNYGFSDKSLDDGKNYLATQKLPLSLNTKEKRKRKGIKPLMCE